MGLCRLETAQAHFLAAIGLNAMWRPREKPHGLLWRWWSLRNSREESVLQNLPVSAPWHDCLVNRCIHAHAARHSR